MHSFSRSGAWVVGILCLCGSSPPAAAHLRSFAAIRSIELDPPLPGTEKAHKELAEALKTLSKRVSWGRPRACCTLRAGLPKPGVLGLECRDPAGSYIGTLRAKRVTELSARLLDYCLESRATPDTLPLTEYRYLFVRLSPHPGQLRDVDYVVKLLRADGTWQVVTSRDVVPAGEADRVLLCEVSAGHDTPTSAGAGLNLYDRALNAVRGIAGESDWTGIHGSLRDAVHNLIDERRLDEEVHRPLPAAPREPK